MSVLPPASTPRVAFRDLANFMRHRSREQAWAAIMSLLITTIILIIFFVDAKVNTTPGQTVYFVESFPADRTDAQIQADQVKDQAARDKAKEAKKKQFQKLAKAFNID